MSHPFVPTDTPGRRVVAELTEDLAESIASVCEAVELEGPQGLDELTAHLASLKEPTTLLLVGWQRMAYAEPGAFSALRAVLQRADEGNDDFVVLHGPISREGNSGLL